MSKWSDRDDYFVNARSEVYSVVDLSSDPLRWVHRRDVTYDGPVYKDLKTLLFQNDFAVNRQRKVIVRLRERNDAENDDFLRVERMVQEMKELKSLLKENGVQNVKELKSLLDNTKADLAKKSTDVDALQRKILDWNSDELRLTLKAIAAAMRKVFVDFGDLRAPRASTDGDSKPVLGFLQKLRDLIVGKRFGSTFLGDANKILDSIETIFYQRNGLKINGIEDTSTTTPTPTLTPADLTKRLSSLREFVENRFFIDGSVIVKTYDLMKEEDIPVIFSDIEAGVEELKLEDKGAMSIDKIDVGNGKSICYGYFNVPSIGKFKGILTRVDFTLPNEITVKLSHAGPNYNPPDEKSFWYVKANGEAIFQKSLSPSQPVTPAGTDFLGFLLRMNKIFVNKKGRYLKFQFTAVKFPGSPHIHDEQIFYYHESDKVFDIITRVQYDINESPAAFSGRGVSLLEQVKTGVAAETGEDWIRRSRPGRNVAFLFKDSCFVGEVTVATGQVFRRNALVTAFFEQSKLGKLCYVDALATTYFVLNPGPVERWTAQQSVVPRINY